MALSPYIKAAIVTLVLAAAGFALIAQIDAARARDLQYGVDAMLFESDSARLMYLYAQTVGTGDPEFCGVLNATMAAQSGRRSEFANKIIEYERASVFSQEYESIRNRYYLTNAELYLYTLSARRNCPSLDAVPVLYFYRIKPECPDCQTQGPVLDALVAKCPSLRVFAFPTGTSYPFIQMLEGKSGIASAPSIVLPGGKVLQGLKNEREIVAGLRESGVTACEAAG